MSFQLLIHAHLDYPQFEGKIDEVLSRAKALGVTEVISIGVKLSAADGPRRLAETYDNVWFSAGIHPHEASSEPAPVICKLYWLQPITLNAWL